MAPTYPPPAHNSLAATGRTKDQFSYQQNPGRNPINGRWIPAPAWTIGKRRRLVEFPPTIFATCSTASADLKTLWEGMDQAHRNSWRHHAKRWRVPLRTAFLTFNMRRAVQSLPFMDHPFD